MKVIFLSLSVLLPLFLLLSHDSLVVIIIPSHLPFSHSSEVSHMVSLMILIGLISSFQIVCMEHINLQFSKFISAWLENAKPFATPMVYDKQFSKLNVVLFFNPNEYRRIIGSLQYLTLTMFDISLRVNKLDQFMDATIVIHW